MSNIERLHAWSHLVLFLMLFMVTLAVMKFSTPTGLASNNQTITSSGVGDLKPFLTAVGLLMGLVIAAVFVVAHDSHTRAQPAPALEKPEPRKAVEREESLDEINRHLEMIRKKLR
jgi:hypothetical protein